MVRHLESKGKKDIEKTFVDYLKLFDVIYHLNGQQTVEINEDNATGISYFFCYTYLKWKKEPKGSKIS